MPTENTSFPAFSHRQLSNGGRLLAAIALSSVLLAGHGLAENPWADSSLGWGPASSRGVSSSGWASWDSTTGGTFGNPYSSHHFTHTAPAVTIAPPPPAAVHSGEIDPVMIKAASIAEQRALPHGTLRCWRYVKEALVAAGGVSSYPQTAYAKDAGRDLMQHYGFVQLPIRSADRAPVGAVLVYGGPGAGHVELRTAHGFASDYCSSNPSFLPFIGAYVRLAPRHHGSETAQAGIPATPGI